ncbi:uncharacterized protein EI90DRAFT_2905635 [Cantharellus anzutake]|uniref:uncharacterized protein n=1 Tax=Cantharellus anzutake TaxID=1750568 RepID=UPI0019061A7B|nr:uncharacterized protein EI90DRAFT_2905635 [Cantharellus anzutake]KAF8341214.1 hypothetical protein EI90DRAFT_2905635 [Cantharellus anzutake]
MGGGRCHRKARWEQRIEKLLQSIERLQVSRRNCVFLLPPNCRISTAGRIFQQKLSGWFVSSIRKLTDQLVRQANVVSRCIGRVNRNKCAEAATRVMIPVFGLAAADRGTDTPDKRDITFFLANILFKLYYELDNVRLCDTILKNLEKQLQRIEAFPMADQTMFHFWHGRIYLTQQRVRQAYEELSKAFTMCTNNSFKNKQIIFTYLVATAIPIGIFPSTSLLEHFGLTSRYGPLIDSIKRGTFTHSILRSGKWFARRGVWMLLREKGEVLVWRSLIRRREQNPSAFVAGSKGPPPTLQLLAIQSALQFSSHDVSYTLNDAESLCCSLLDQGYVKGYILHSRQLLALQKAENLGFPPPCTIVVDSGLLDGAVDYTND